MAHSVAFDFDNINEWGVRLQRALSEIVTPRVKAAVQATSPQYIEDAGDTLFQQIESPIEFAGYVADWLKQQAIIAYHGSRLASDEIASIRRDGLRILQGSDRETRLRKILIHHPNWQQLLEKLPDTISKYTDGNRAGHRQGQAHATLSRAGLTRGFNHYLKYGSEFDQHAMYDLLKDEGTELLRLYGKPQLIQLAIPGNIAFDACHRFQILENNIPNLVRIVLNSWAYWLVNPSYTPESIEMDCGFIFYEPIPSSWITAIIPLKDEELFREPVYD